MMVHILLIYGQYMVNIWLMVVSMGFHGDITIAGWCPVRENPANKMHDFSGYILANLYLMW